MSPLYTECKALPISHKQACAFEIKSIDADGSFAGYASVFDVVDNQNDVVKRGAFRNSLRGRDHPVQLLWQHQWEHPIGRIESLVEDDHGLYIQGKLLLDVTLAREAYALLKAGVIRGMSIGYNVKHASRDPLTGVRELLELELWEVSLVTFPANEAAQVTVVKSHEPGMAHLLKAIRQAEMTLYC